MTPPSDPPSDEAITEPAAPDPSGKSAKVFKIVGIVVASIILLVVVGMLIAVMSNNNKRPVRRAPRRYSRYDDDYDD